MKLADHATALDVCRLATRIPEPEQVPAARRVLATLGLIPYGDLFEPLPTACGHPSSSLRRDTVHPGMRCVDCQRERRVAR